MNTIREVMMKKIVILTLMLFGVVTIFLNGWQDEELFYNQVKPNILVIFDTSGSMREIIKYPTGGLDGIPAGQPGDTDGSGYDLSVSYSGTYYYGNADYIRKNSVWVARWVNDARTIANDDPASGTDTGDSTGCYEIDSSPPAGVTNGYRVGDNGYNFSVGERLILMDKRTTVNCALATLKSIYEKNGALWFELEDVVGGPIVADASYSDHQFQRNPGWTPRIVKLYGTTFPVNGAGYAEFAPEIRSNYYKWLFLHATDAQLAGVTHFCDYGTFDVNDLDLGTGLPRSYPNAWTKIQVARQAIEDIVIGFKDKVQMGLFQFNGSNGARVGSTTISGTTVNAWVKDMADDTDRNNLIQIVRSFYADGNTPLAESLAETWRYFQGASSWYTGYGTYTSPCDFYCRRNFVVFMTDGEPTADDSFRTVTDKDEGSQLYCYDWTKAPADVSGLTDVNYHRLSNTAWFMFNNDARTDLDEIQNIETSTIGFTTTGNTNRLLENTATNGGGNFYLANNARDLLSAFEDIFGKIYEKSTSYAQFAAPKQSKTSGIRGYIATFIPKNNKAMWEGHLKCYRLIGDGLFNVDDNGNPNDSPIPPDTGWLYWDAGLKLKEREADDRDIFTWIDGVKVDFTRDNVDNGTITPAMLGVTIADPDQAKNSAKAIVDDIRGATNAHNYTYPSGTADNKRWKLGDIFHFNPLVVGVPLKTRADSGVFPGYKDFYDYYSGNDTGAYPGNEPREEVIYAGANDGMLHCFRVEDGEELWAFIPPASLKKLKAIANNDNHEYFVDGKGMVEDIRTGTGTTYQDWRTVLVFGMGLGGSSYYAMDITDPADPSLRWEIGVATHGANVGKSVVFNPDGSETVISTDAVLGFTEDRPSLGNINYSPNPFPAAVLSGGHDPDELAGSVNKIGKSLFILHAYDGTIIKEFRYNATDSHLASQWLDNDFKYSMPSGPIMIDKNNNRVADAIYQADIGGRLWKIDLTSAAPSNWLPEIIFDTNATITNGLSSQPFFISPTIGIDRNYDLLVFIGTGLRSNPNDQTSTGKMFVFKDDGAQPSGGYKPSDLQDITTFFQNNQNNLDSDLDGYPDTQEIAAGTDPNNPLDHPQGDPPNTKKVIDDPNGFYFTFLKGSGEKLFDPKPIFFNYNLIFNTYVPPVSAGGAFDPCNPGGSLYVYTFRLSTAQNEDVIQDTDVTKGKIVGSGLLSGGRFLTYIGDGSFGSTSLSGVRSIPPGQNFGRMLWLEHKR
jgi:type IV pilus assembly protein PilY1